MLTAERSKLAIADNSKCATTSWL